MAVTKVGTCCYCGTRAALVLRGETRHELACSSCGAPLHALKMLPNQSEAAGKTSEKKRRATPHHGSRTPPKEVAKRPKKRKKSKGLGAKIWDEVWDVIEDIID